MFEQCAYVLQESIFSSIPINVLYHLLEFFMCAALFICHLTCIILCRHGLVGKNEEKKTFVVGDLNSRIGCLSDILESDRYLDAEFDDNDIYDDEFYRDNNILKNRKNMDNIVDNNGRKLISLCKSTGHIIANGRLHNDSE